MRDELRPRGEHIVIGATHFHHSAPFPREDVEELLAPIDSAVVVADSNLLEDEGEAGPRARGALWTEHWVRA